MLLFDGLRYYIFQWLVRESPLCPSFYSWPSDSHVNLSFFSNFRYGKIYLKAAENSLKKGADYAKNEIQRLERILEKVWSHTLCNIIHAELRYISLVWQAG